MKLTVTHKGTSFVVEDFTTTDADTVIRFISHAADQARLLNKDPDTDELLLSLNKKVATMEAKSEEYMKFNEKLIQSIWDAIEELKKTNKHN